ncbi:putative tRNA 2'-phosphotransferase [Ceratina calcarata]|uniref:tRNA 2'-phosphotransferase n=1 Tax=Ceratina calcarata TaxID=156304 RepID=A0AAJ7NET1_9HYME|nr:putative tRNA 2'-phosphotransferase [Ceratina calcarata]
MENLSSESDSEDSFNVACKNWDRITDAAKKTGYRKGIEDGTDSVFQEGFDKGYKEGFQTAFLLGKFKSLLNVVPPNVERPQNIKEILDKTRRGACYLCMTASHEEEKSFSQIDNEQQLHSIRILQTLHEYFQPYAKPLNFNDLNEFQIQSQIPKITKSESDD